MQTQLACEIHQQIEFFEELASCDAVNGIRTVIECWETSEGLHYVEIMSGRHGPRKLRQKENIVLWLPGRD